MTDAEFLTAFEGCTLPKERWTHEAHLRMAWLVARREPTLEDAIDCARRGIKAYNASRGGEPGKYHETVTLAYMTLIRRAIEADGAGETFDAFKSAHPALFVHYPGPLLDHYTRETLDARAAYAAFVAPDRAPLP